MRAGLVQRCVRRDRTANAVAIAVALLVQALASAPAVARVLVPTDVGAMTRAAARVFRGRCVAAAAETVDVGGVRLPATAYTFRVREHLKGARTTTVTFRQVGVRDGGARDLGSLVGLPVYAPGEEYVLFLLPESAAGVTSPAGAAEGAFLVQGDVVTSVRGAPVPAPPARAASRAAGAPLPRSYDELRRAVLGELAR